MKSSEMKSSEMKSSDLTSTSSLLKNYTATGSLLKNYLRDSKVITLLLVCLPFLFAYGAAASNIALLTGPELLAEYISQNQGNLLLGSIAAETMEAATIWRIRISAAVILSILSVVLMINNTRKDEEQGRLELLRSGAVGAKAPLCAALIKVIGANLLGGLFMAVGFCVVGFPAVGSFTAGISTALCACCFAAIASLSAQLAPDSRMAGGMVYLLIAISMVWQVIANIIGNDLLLLFTPLGWCAYSRAYAGENMWLFVFAVLVIAAFILVAFILSERRDMGGSYFKEKTGREYAKRSFKTPFALAWHLQKGTLIVWLCAYALMGVVIASLRESINEMLGGTNFLPELSAIVGGAGSAFLAILSYILTQVITAYAILAVMRVREEESRHRTDIVLSGVVSRVRYVSGHLVFAFVGSAVAIALFGLATGDLYGCISRIPAVWVVTSVSVLVYGVLPRVAASVSWGLFGALLALEFLWEMRFIGNDVFKISPFAWVYPGVSVSAGPVVVMLLIAAVMTAVGLVGFSRRDIVTE